MFGGDSILSHVEDWRIGGLEDWRIGRLEDWRIGGLPFSGSLKV
jgi:hypothetical protein